MFDPIIFFLAITCGIALTLAITVAKEPHRPAARPFISLMLGAAIWSVGNLLEIASTPVDLKIVAVQVEYLGIVLIPISWFFITLEYTGRDHWITSKRIALLAMIPLATLILAWTNSYHHLLWQNAQTTLNNTNGHWITVFQPAFWVHAIFSYGLLITGDLILIEFSLKNPKYYRSSILLLVVAVTLPTLTNVLFVSGVYRPFQIDPTPALFAVSGAAIAWILFHQRAFKSLPISYDAIIDKLSAGVIIIETNERIISFNQAAQELLSKDEQLQTGRLLEQSFQTVSGFYNVFRLANKSQHEVIWQDEYNHNYYEMQIKRLTDTHGREIGSILINHDISAYINTQKAVEESELKYRTLFESTNESIFIEDLAGNILDCNSAACEAFGYTLSEFQKIKVPDLVPQEKWPDLEREFVTIQQAKELWKESVSKRSDGSVFPTEVRSRLLSISDESRLIVHVRDITEQKAAEQELKERLTITEALYEISRSLIKSSSLEPILQSILEKVAQVLQCDTINLILFDIDREQIVNRFTGGAGADQIVPVSYAELMEGLTGWCVHESQPAISNGLGPDARESPAVQARRRAAQCGSIMVAPLSYQARKFGTITAAKLPNQGDFSLQEQTLLVAIANQIAIAVENNRLLVSERKQREQAETLREVAGFLNARLDDEHVIAAILEQLEKVIEFDSATVMLVNKDRTLSIAADRNFPAPPSQLVGIRYDELEHVRYVLEKGEPLIIADTNQEPSWRFNDSGHQIGCWLGVPLIAQGQVIGLLNLDSQEPNFYQPEHARLASVYANQAAIAIQNARLLEASVHQAQEAETLRRATSAVVSTLNQDEAIERILEQLEKVIAYDSASVQIYENNESVIIGGRGWLDQRSVLGLRFPIPGDNPQTRVIQTRRPFLSGNASEVYPSLPGTKHGPIQSWLGVPLIVRDQLIGILVLDNHQENYYDREDARLVSAFADQVAIAIENARMFTEEQQRVQQLDALRATMTDISSELELPKLLRAVLVRAIGLLNASGGDLALYQENPNDIVIVASHNMGIDNSGSHLKVGEGVLGKVAKSLQPLVLNEYPTWSGKSSHLPNEPWQAALATPLLIGGRLVGCIEIVSIHQQRKFSQEDQRLLNLFAQQAAIAVENARLYQSAREAAERRAILHRISQEIVAANLEPESIYYAIHKASSQLTVCESFVISLVREAEQEIEAVYLFDRGGRNPSQRAPIGQGLSGYVIETGRSLYIPDLLHPATPIQGFHFGTKNSVRSVLAVPMRLGKQIIGVISTQSYSPFAYTSEDQYLMEMLASYAAIALSNTHLFQTVQQLAITDPLTGLFNRRHLFELGEREFFRALRFHRPITAIMIDIDHFKRVNDYFGHATGDEVLIELAERMQSIIRDVDILARYGGEEFTILIPETSAEESLTIGERIRKAISFTPFTAKGFLFNITVSIGVAGNNTETPDLAALIDQADQALYDAKHAGRNQIAIRSEIKSLIPTGAAIQTGMVNQKVDPL